MRAPPATAWLVLRLLLFSTHEILTSNRWLMHPLLFSPLYRRYLWGGRRFATALGRTLPPGDDFAESWELVDREADQSVVAAGALKGSTLGQLVQSHGRDLLGRHSPQKAFPLLFKFLDANRDLSVQVHPDDARAATLGAPDLGKTEAWYIVDAIPGSRIYAGLREGIDHRSFAEAVRAGECEASLHSFEAKPGDCIFIPAGTVHAIGAGLLVAEIQQSSDVTYRLHDWNRTGSDGKPRPLHIEAGIDAVTKQGPVEPTRSVPTHDLLADPVRRLVASDYFTFDQVRPTSTWTVGGDDRCHFLAAIDGSVSFDPAWRLPLLVRGQSVLLPASIGQQPLHPMPGSRPVQLLHVCMP